MNQCKVCLKSYVWPQDLQRHIKLKHPIKEKGDTENLHHQQKYTVFSQQQQQQQQQYSMSTQQQQNTSNNYLLGIHVSEPGIYDTSQNDYSSSRYFSSNIHLLPTYRALPHVEKLTL